RSNSRFTALLNRSNSSLNSPAPQLGEVSVRNRNSLPSISFTASNITDSLIASFFAVFHVQMGQKRFSQEYVLCNLFTLISSLVRNNKKSLHVSNLTTDFT